MNNPFSIPQAQEIPSPEKLEEERTIILESLKALVTDITRGTHIMAEELQNGYRLTVPLLEQRTQKVYVTFGRRDADGENLFQIYTICAEAKPDIYEAALRLNMELDYGATAIYTENGKDYLVMVDTQLVRAAQPAEIEKSVLTLAETGDYIEKFLTAEDIQ